MQKCTPAPLTFVPHHPLPIRFSFPALVRFLSTLPADAAATPLLPCIISTRRIIINCKDFSTCSVVRFFLFFSSAGPFASACSTGPTVRATEHAGVVENVLIVWWVNWSVVQPFSSGCYQWRRRVKLHLHGTLRNCVDKSSPYSAQLASHPPALASPQKPDFFVNLSVKPHAVVLVSDSRGKTLARRLLARAELSSNGSRMPTRGHLLCHVPKRQAGRRCVGPPLQLRLYQACVVNSQEPGSCSKQPGQEPQAIHGSPVIKSNPHTRLCRAPRLLATQDAGEGGSGAFQGHSRRDVQGHSSSAANASDRPHNQLSQCDKRFRSWVGTKKPPAESSMAARTRTSSGKRLPRSHRASARRKKCG